MAGCPMRTARAAYTLLIATMAAGCADTRAEAPAEREAREAAQSGLPQRLQPSDPGTPGYAAQMSCAPELRDPEHPGARLRRVREAMRTDQWERGDTTVSVRYAQGLYAVHPAGLYGLEPGQLLRVDCARQAATGVVSSRAGAPEV